MEYPEQFGDLIKAIEVEKFLEKNVKMLSVPAEKYQKLDAFLKKDFLKALSESNDDLET